MKKAKKRAPKDLWGREVQGRRELRISREGLSKALQWCFRGCSLEEISLWVTNPLVEMAEYLDLCAGADTCRKTSLLFNPHRMSVAMKRQRSLEEGLKDDRWFFGLARGLLSKAQTGSDRHVMLHSALTRGVDSVFLVADFPPFIARDFCKKASVGVGSKVLDPCAGWGGRMLGVSVVGAEYIGYEPATKTHAGLLRLRRFIQKMNPGFVARVRCQPFEESDLPPDTYDFALTSPPYYDTERYSNEPTQSYVRYKSFEEWCEGFFYPLVLKTMEALKPRAIFVLNVGDRKYPLSERLRGICKGRFEVMRLNSYMPVVGGGRKREAGEKFYAIRKPV